MGRSSRSSSKSSIRNFRWTIKRGDNMWEEVVEVVVKVVLEILDEL